MILITFMCYGYLSQFGNYLYNGGASVADFANDFLSIPYNMGTMVWKGFVVGIDRPFADATKKNIEQLIKIGKISAIVTGVSLTAGFAAQRYRKFRENRLLDRISKGYQRIENMDISYKIKSEGHELSTKARLPDQKANLITLGHSNVIPPIGNVKRRK